jgi:hypothetical protein
MNQINHLNNKTAAPQRVLEIRLRQDERSNNGNRAMTREQESAAIVQYFADVARWHLFEMLINTDHGLREAGRAYFAEAKSICDGKFPGEIADAWRIATAE